MSADEGTAAQTTSTTEAEDERELAQLGYKQELLRGWSSFTNFAISFTIISVLAGTLHHLRSAWNAGGPVAITIGWPIICVFVLLVAFSMAELTSAFPTAGGPYWWAAGSAAPGWSWFTGWFNIVGLVGIVASVGYGAASFLYAVLGLYGLKILGVDFGDTKHVLSETFLLFLIILVLYTLVNIYSSPLVGAAEQHLGGLARPRRAGDHRDPHRRARAITRASASCSATRSTTPGSAAARRRASPSGSWCYQSGSC